MEDYVEVRPLAETKPHKVDGEYCEVRPLTGAQLREPDDEYAEVRPLDVTKKDKEDYEYPSFSTKDILKMAQKPEIQSQVAQLLSKEKTAPEIEKTIEGDARSRYRERIKAMKQSRCKR